MLVLMENDLQDSIPILQQPRIHEVTSPIVAVFSSWTFGGRCSQECLQRHE